MAQRRIDPERGGFEPWRRKDGLDKLKRDRFYRREAQEARNMEGRRKHRAAVVSSWG